MSCLFLAQNKKEKACPYTAKLYIWFCKVGHLADPQKPSTNSTQCGADVGSERTAEGTAGGTCLLQNDGHYAGVQKYMGC